jgi:hypothetical protein
MTTFTGSAGSADLSPGSAPATPAGRRALDAALTEVRDTAHDVRLVIGSQERGTGRTVPVVTPHEHKVTLGWVHHPSADVGGGVGDDEVLAAGLPDHPRVVAVPVDVLADGAPDVPERARTRLPRKAARRSSSTSPEHVRVLGPGPDQRPADAEVHCRAARVPEEHELRQDVEEYQPMGISYSARSKTVGVAQSMIDGNSAMYQFGQAVLTPGTDATTALTNLSNALTGLLK